MKSLHQDTRRDVPTLAQKHSGIPASLLDKARALKEETLGVQTKSQSHRQRLPVLPQGVERDAFFRAIDELRQEIGGHNVELNDKPWEAGW